MGDHFRDRGRRDDNRTALALRDEAGEAAIEREHSAAHERGGQASARLDRVVHEGPAALFRNAVNMPWAKTVRRSGPGATASTQSPGFKRARGGAARPVSAAERQT